MSDHNDASSVHEDPTQASNDRPQQIESGPDPWDGVVQTNAMSYRGVFVPAVQGTPLGKLPSEGVAALQIPMGTDALKRLYKETKAYPRAKNGYIKWQCDGCGNWVRQNEECNENEGKDGCCSLLCYKRFRDAHSLDEKANTHIFVKHTGKDAVGAGVFARKRIKKGEYIDEYLGEIVPESAGKDDVEGYSFALNRHVGNEGGAQKVYIDSRWKGNDIRFLNSSCDPNVEAVELILHNIRGIFIRAIKDIEEGEEICLFYGYEYFAQKEAVDGEEILCHCGNPPEPHLPPENPKDTEDPQGGNNDDSDSAPKKGVAKRINKKRKARDNDDGERGEEDERPAKKQNSTSSDTSVEGISLKNVFSKPATKKAQPGAKATSSTSRKPAKKAPAKRGRPAKKTGDEASDAELPAEPESANTEGPKGNTKTNQLPTKSNKSDSQTVTRSQAEEAASGVEDEATDQPAARKAPASKRSAKRPRSENDHEEEDDDDHDNGDRPNKKPRADTTGTQSASNAKASTASQSSKSKRAAGSTAKKAPVQKKQQSGRPVGTSKTQTSSVKSQKQPVNDDEVEDGEGGEEEQRQSPTRKRSARVANAQKEKESKKEVEKQEAEQEGEATAKQKENVKKPKPKPKSQGDLDD